MKKRVENQENLQVKQAEIVNVITDEDNNVTEVVTHTGVEYKVKAVIIASGTYLKGKILIGSYSRESVLTECSLQMNFRKIFADWVLN